jgi:hypothetical protein
MSYAAVLRNKLTLLWAVHNSRRKQGGALEQQLAQTEQCRYVRRIGPWAVCAYLWGCQSAEWCKQCDVTWV